MIEYFVGAECARGLHLRGCGRREDARAVKTCELDRRLADTAAAGEHEHRFS